MKITLISLDHELYCIGIRTLSSCLKKAGHSVQCIFMPPEKAGAERSNKYQATYSRRLLDQVGMMCGDSKLIGISLMTNQYLQAVNVTNHLKKQGIRSKIIWGGIHPTVEPEVCLEHADMVCIGEGEHALVELADYLEREDQCKDIHNIWVRNENELIRNSVRPLIQMLDSIPLPDYSCEGHYVTENDLIQELNIKRMVNYQAERYRAYGNKINYPVMTSRGCPFACSYCCNSVFKSLYPHQRRLRWRSAGYVIAELKMIQSTLAPLGYVYYVDDNFTARSNEELRKFCELYHEAIGVPYFAQISPLTISREKIETLLNSGCVKIVMGIETGSERIAKIYNRTRSHKAVQAGISILENYRHRMPLPPSYQFIIDNPYETMSETLETLRLAVSLPQPWDNPIYSLMLFPGTLLYDQANRDGLIYNKTEQIYGKDWLDHSKPYYRIWVRLYRANIPAWLLKILLKPWIAYVLTHRIADIILGWKPFRLVWEKPRQR